LLGLRRAKDMLVHACVFARDRTRAKIVKKEQRNCVGTHARTVKKEQRNCVGAHARTVKKEQRNCVGSEALGKLHVKKFNRGPNLLTMRISLPLLPRP